MLRVLALSAISGLIIGAIFFAGSIYLESQNPAPVINQPVEQEPVYTPPATTTITTPHATTTVTSTPLVTGSKPSGTTTKPPTQPTTPATKPPSGGQTTTPPAGTTTGAAQPPANDTTPKEPGTLYVSLSADPDHGTAPLMGVDVSATVSGTETGKINYTFYCNRQDLEKTIKSGYNAKVDNLPLTSYLFQDLCDFKDPGTYYVKVVVERGSQAAQSVGDIIVIAPTVNAPVSTGGSSLNPGTSYTTPNNNNTPGFQGNPVESYRFGAYFAGAKGLWGTQTDWQQDIARAQPLGIGRARFNADLWDQMEPTRGNYAWTRPDIMVNALGQANIDILFTLPLSNAWNYSTSSLAAAPAGYPRTHIAPDDYSSTRDFARAIATKYAGRIKYYEVWNEPDFPSFWENNPNAAEYYNVLKAAYEGVKQGDPSAKVVLGGLAMPNNTTWLQQLLNLGGGAYFDIMNIHIYPAFGNYQQGITNNRSLLQQYGLYKPMWITETSTTGGYFETTDRTTEEYLKAVYLVKNYSYALAQSDIDAIFWHTLHNPGVDVGLPKDYDFGLMTGAGVALPAYDAHQVFSNKLLGSRAYGTFDLGSNLTAYKYKKTNGTAAVVWAETGSGLPTGIPTSVTSVTRTSMFGTSTVMTRAQAISASIGTEPVYLEYTE